MQYTVGIWLIWGLLCALFSSSYIHALKQQQKKTHFVCIRTACPWHTYHRGNIIYSTLWLIQEPLCAPISSPYSFTAWPRRIPKHHSTSASDTLQAISKAIHLYGPSAFSLSHLLPAHFPDSVSCYHA